MPQKVPPVTIVAPTRLNLLQRSSPPWASTMDASNSFTVSLLELSPVVGMGAAIDVQGLASHEWDRRGRRIDGHRSLVLLFRDDDVLDWRPATVDIIRGRRPDRRPGGVVPSAGPALRRQGREAGAELLGTLRAHVEVFGRPPQRLRDGLAGGDQLGVARREPQPVVAADLVRPGQQQVPGQLAKLLRGQAHVVLLDWAPPVRLQVERLPYLVPADPRRFEPALQLLPGVVRQLVQRLPRQPHLGGD